MQNLSKEERVHKVFEKIYDNYDTMNSVISFKQHLHWRKDTMKCMDVQAGESALDLCCGTGDWTIALAKKTGEGSEVVGLDFSEGMLSVAAKKLKESCLENRVQLIQGNAMSLPFEDNHFDYVTIGFGLRNTPDYLTVLKEMHRVLKPGGLAACMETSVPTTPIYKHLFQFYFNHIMPVFGKLVAKSYQEYAWLNESTEVFLSKKELKQLFEQAGFREVYYRSYSGGVTATHFGRKAK